MDELYLFIITHNHLLNRSLHRQHTAECRRDHELLQAAVGGRGPGSAGERADPADLPHGLPAAAPPGPPGGAAAAARPAAEPGHRPGRGGSVDPEETIETVFLCRRLEPRGSKELEAHKVSECVSAHGSTGNPHLWMKDSADWTGFCASQPLHESLGWTMLQKHPSCPSAYFI